MRVIRLGRKNSPKQQMIIVVVAMVVILLLHISDFIPVTAGQLAEKYHLQIKEISYYEEGVLIWEKELTTDESEILLEQWKEIKLYQPLSAGFAEKEELGVIGRISLRYSGYQGNDEEKEVFGNFSILETGELGSVRHAFYPKGMKHQELYESLLEMGK